MDRIEKTTAHHYCLLSSDYLIGLHRHVGQNRQTYLTAHDAFIDALCHPRAGSAQEGGVT
jgi:hypothetical protein